MKKAILLVAVLALTLPCFAQSAERSSTHGGSNGAASIGMRPAPAPRPSRTWSRTQWIQSSGDSYFFTQTSGATTTSAPTITRNASSITVVHNDGSWQPSTYVVGGQSLPQIEPQASLSWTPMLFAPATGEPPSLGAIARDARGAKADAGKAHVKIKQDANGTPVVVERK